MVVGPPLFVVAFFPLASAESLATSFNLPASIIQSDVLLWQRLAAMLAAAFPVAFVSLGMWQARKCFLAFADGAMFTTPAVGYLRRFAAWMLAATLADFVMAPVVSALLTASNQPGSHKLILEVNAGQLLMLPRIAMMWLLAAVIGQIHSSTNGDTAEQPPGEGDRTAHLDETES